MKCKTKKGGGGEKNTCLNGIIILIVCLVALKVLRFAYAPLDTGFMARLPTLSLDWASDLLWPLANNKSESEKFDMFVLTESLKFDIAYCVL